MGIGVHPCIHLAISLSIHPSIHPSICLSIYPSDLASIRPSSHTESHTRWQGCTHACTHVCTCKSTHLLILCPSRPSVACIHTRTFRHAHIYAYIHAYSTGPVTQLAARQICNLSSVKGSWCPCPAKKLSWRLVMRSWFLQPFSLNRWIKIK